MYFQKISLRFPLQWLVLRIFIYGKPCNIIKRRPRHGCFPVNFVNTFFTEQLWVEASVGLHKVPKIYITLSACNANSECEICFIEIGNHEDVFLENLGSICINVTETENIISRQEMHCSGRENRFVI